MYRYDSKITLAFNFTAVNFHDNICVAICLLLARRCFFRSSRIFWRHVFMDAEQAQICNHTVVCFPFWYSNVSVTMSTNDTVILSWLINNYKYSREHSSRISKATLLRSCCLSTFTFWSFTIFRKSWRHSSSSVILWPPSIKGQGGVLKMVKYILASEVFLILSGWIYKIYTRFITLL